MDWRDQGALLNVRRHGETSAIIEVFTAEHGRHAGVVRGGTSRKTAPFLQPGAQLDLTWRARLDEHLGSFAIEPVKSRAAQVMGDRVSLAGLNSVTALLSFVLPEREPHATLYTQTIALLDMIGTSDVWPVAYLRWELALLDEMGFGLDLSKCALTGGTDDLIYVSPKSGRAVSGSAAGDWADRLLPLSPAMTDRASGDLEEVRAGLTTTGYFLGQKLAPELVHKPLPEARRRLMDALARAS
jgi:DNA repair protein RecO (recombination protein O)